MDRSGWRLRSTDWSVSETVEILKAVFCDVDLLSRSFSLFLEHGFGSVVSYIPTNVIHINWKIILLKWFASFKLENWYWSLIPFEQIERTKEKHSQKDYTRIILSKVCWKLIFNKRKMEGNSFSRKKGYTFIAFPKEKETQHSAERFVVIKM